ncbi:hypothetical protein EON76_00130 [bacterium]|nr:MAG: hypothetical protein EON76_00130 [bacterium]
MLTPEIIILLIVASINAIVVWIVASQGWSIVANRYFILTALSVIPWALGIALFFGANDVRIADLGLIGFYVSPMFMILFLSLFAAVFPANKNATFIIPNVILSVATVLIACVIVYDSHILTSSVYMSNSGNNILSIEPLWYTIYFMYFGMAFFVAFAEFFIQMRSQQGIRKRQIQYIFAGMFLAVAFSTITNLLLPLVGYGEFIWLGPVWTLLAVIAITIAIIKHQLFDIKLAAVRSAAYLFSLVSLGLIYYMMAYIVSIILFQGQTTSSVSVSPINILLALILAFAFQPIKQFFDKLTDSIFYKDRYQTDDFFAEFSELLASTTDLRGLLERASLQIANTFKAEQAFFLLYYTNGKRHHMSAGTAKHSRMPMDDALLLDQTVAMNGDEIIVTQLLPEQSQLRRMLVSHKITLVMPLVHAGYGIGYVFLGEQRSGSYTKRDLKVLTTVADELIIAIQNALSVHEIKEINATLQQRIDVATKELRSSNSQLRHLDEVKDEFISMASHQLRTPLTSIKGYMSMVLEGDMGKITPQQHAVLTEAFNSSERMVRLIADFLNVSRLQTGKFIIEKNPVDIVSVVKGEIDSLQLIAKSHDMKLAFHAPKTPIMIAIDEAKVRQVIMNFVDNAIYYSRANSTITVNVEAKDSAINFTVVDAGIGVPLEEQAMLFNKFFRAKNARKQRPDGTGVGLYLAKKVITAHDGKMIFASNAGEGSTFGFSIPVKQQASSDVSPS